MVGTIVATVAIAAITNGLLAVFHLNQTHNRFWPSFAPPGATIGVIWIVLFAGMGAALWLAPKRRAVAVLIALCLAYPFYTHALGGHLIELIGNLVTLAYATGLALALRRAAPLAATFVAAVAAWIVFATILVLGLVQLNGWATSAIASSVTA